MSAVHWADHRLPNGSSGCRYESYGAPSSLGSWLGIDGNGSGVGETERVQPDGVAGADRRRYWSQSAGRVVDDGNVSTMDGRVARGRRRRAPSHPRRSTASCLDQLPPWDRPDRPMSTCAAHQPRTAFAPPKRVEVEHHWLDRSGRSAGRWLNDSTSLLFNPRFTACRPQRAHRRAATAAGPALSCCPTPAAGDAPGRRARRAGDLGVSTGRRAGRAHQAVAAGEQRQVKVDPSPGRARGRSGARGASGGGTRATPTAVHPASSPRERPVATLLG